MNATHTDTRQVLLEAALFCFAERGYDATSMRMVAQRAGRPLSLIAHHFGNKEGLYREVFSFLLDQAPRPQAMGPDVPVPRDRVEAVRLFRERVHTLFRDVCTWTGPEDALREASVRLWMRELRAPRPEIQAFFQQRLRPWVEAMKACIRVLRPDLREEEVAFLGISIQGQVSAHGLMLGLNRLLWGEVGDSLGAFGAAELLADFCLRGLGVEQAR